MREYSSSAFFEEMQKPSVKLCELIDFAAPNSTYRWTTTNKIIVNSAIQYEPFPGNISQGLEEELTMKIANVDFSLANSGGIWDDLLVSNGFDFASVTVRRVFPNSPDFGEYTYFTGKIGEHSYNRDVVSGKVRSIYDSVQVQFPHYNYGDTCVWRFGSTGCAFDASSVTIIGSADFISSGNLSLTTISGFISGSFNNGYFDFGRLTMIGGANSGQLRTIRYQTQDVLDLSHPLPFSVDTGDQFTIFPGCRHRFIEDCVSKYNNSSNFVGAPWIPKQEQAF